VIFHDAVPPGRITQFHATQRRASCLQRIILPHACASITNANAIAT